MPALSPLLAPPQTQQQLLAQAQRLAGYSLGELAALAGIPIPRDLKRDKAGRASCWRFGWAPAPEVSPSRISPRWASS
ncbi:Methyl-directed mismatch repair protein [Raoultella terrigena]|uniref:Methyl-directed mismatch repair protein n=1 Tax=Raoultella terrigena TaxID=577 RepID=A0A4U9D5E6_RAOTE|nr:Methyl-directed mismatch repair protein [Raoultella terrigena]